jgi:hypothetical protein
VTDRAETFDPIAIIRVLNEHQVRFVVIGGIAAGVQGAEWLTTDLDVVRSRTSGSEAARERPCSSRRGARRPAARRKRSG